MRDREVRCALHQKLLSYHHRDPDTLVVDELGLRHGASRVDIAVVNGYLHGFEIKSDADTLQRLPRQASDYNAVLDRVTLVIGERHVARTIDQAPDWWGIHVATKGQRGAIHFQRIRRPRLNREVDPSAVAQLLWRTEVSSVLASRGAPDQLLRKPRKVLYCYLAEIVGLDELRGIVREQLKSRENWRRPK